MNTFERLQEVALLGRRATLDPSAFTRRGPDNDGNAYAEPLDRWQRRAIDVAVRQLLEEPNKGVRLTGDRDGKTYDPEIDFDRLNKQMRLVWSVIRTGRWYSLNELTELTGCPTPSVSARLRDLRKPKFGAQEIERKRIEGGYWVYRLVRIPNPKEWAE